MKRLFPVLLAVALLIIPSTLAAQDDSDDSAGFTATVQAGPTFFFDLANETRRGYHVDIYPGWEVTDGLSVEFNFGFRTTNFQNQAIGNTTLSYIPAVVPGIRYHFNPYGVVQPYIHSHLGLGFVKDDSNLFNDGESPEKTFTFNYGAGLDVWVIDELAVGAGVTGRHHLVNSELQHLLEVDVGISVKF